ncbi:hypothetical protein NQ176_g1088 [Zarea fungicola]|uniref:Uncharacterized protein n=1 Tax=Zarea fungicola TaxID=93591 RepID=A0ACC1NU59_9HYPO|nr:hypothetical protein NQ176_g1088 [Lecanicillium fungicola]
MALLSLRFAAVILLAGAAVATPCASITAPAVPGATVLSVVASELLNVTLPPVLFYLPVGASGLNVCDVKVNLTHPGVNDNVLVQVWLPLEGWNGRFLGTGGGGWATGSGSIGLAGAVMANFSGAMTDGGHANSLLDPSTWALNSDGSINSGLLTDFASRSLHDMTVVGKAVTKQFYGKAPSYSYWSGCSTGGRQGLMEAQKYPGDYNGILAASPAINWPSLIMAAQWPQVVMQQEKTFPPQCVFDGFIAASIAQCDILDGVKDGIIGDPGSCPFDPYKLVGSSVNCDSTEITVTYAMADIVRKVLDGPTDVIGRQLWYGLNAGTPLNALALTVPGPHGTTVGVPFTISDFWIRYFLKRQPNFNTSTITYLDFSMLFAQSNLEYENVIGTNDPDLSAFSSAGGKMITWHGLADPLIPPDGTLQYRQQVDNFMGGSSSVDKFYRVFFAPGVGHCGMGIGPVPTAGLDALVAWVEKGIAPDTLAAAGTDANGAATTKNICRYPLVSRYDGKGDPKSAASYSCASSFTRT